MREFTLRQMSETDGGYAFWRAFLCGSLVVATVATFVLSPPVGRIAQFTVFSGGLASCADAFF